jgi:hypothetical protein
MMGSSGFSELKRNERAPAVAIGERKLAKQQNSSQSPPAAPLVLVSVKASALRL